MPPKKKPATKAEAVKKTPVKKPAAKKMNAAAAAAAPPKKKAIPTKPYALSFDSGDEPDDSGDDEEDWVGGAFLSELRDRGEEVSCGHQTAKAVYNLVVGKEGGTVLLDAGVNETKGNCIIVGQKGKPITPQEFAQACLKMGKLREEHEGKTYFGPHVEIFPPASGFFDSFRRQGVEWVVKVTYDS